MHRCRSSQRILNQLLWINSLSSSSLSPLSKSTKSTSGLLVSLNKMLEAPSHSAKVRKRSRSPKKRSSLNKETKETTMLSQSKPPKSLLTKDLKLNVTMAKQDQVAAAAVINNKLETNKEERSFRDDELELSNRINTSNNAKTANTVPKPPPPPPTPPSPSASPSPLPSLSKSEETNAIQKLEKYEINKLLMEFRSDEKVRSYAEKSGLTAKSFMHAMLSFRKECLASTTSNRPKLNKALIDAAAKKMDLYSYFIHNARQTYPHVSQINELRQVSDLAEPANWFAEARALAPRRIIYHAGPTNSGKTYAALKAFMASETGIYCGPLKLLANEVFVKANESGRNDDRDHESRSSSASCRCDLLTGEERRYASGNENEPAAHVACTVEMASLDKSFDVAVIDEIQMIGDAQRGWAWTRAFLGLRAKTIHVCGDKSAIKLISTLAKQAGDVFEVHNYARLTPLTVLDEAVEYYERVEPGDCIVCFNKSDIFTVVSELERRGYHQVAIIYGSMPPQAKLAQAARFNDPADPCKVLVATDAVGMGLNLNIRRVVFYSLRKPLVVVEDKSQTQPPKISAGGSKSKSKKFKPPQANPATTTVKEFDYITTSQALQIAGRAGRFNTHFKDGFVTTFHKSDLPILKQILRKKMGNTERAGLHPTSEQIELFGYYLPTYSLSDLIELFLSICRLDANGHYFLSSYEDISRLASLIDHMRLKLNVKYTFATAPIGEKQAFAWACYVKFVRAYANGETLTAHKLRRIVGLGEHLATPATLEEISHLECVYDVLDLYLWLAYRFPDVFCDRERCFEMRAQLEEVIYKGVTNISQANHRDNPSNSKEKNQQGFPSSLAPKT